MNTAQSTLPLSQLKRRDIVKIEIPATETPDSETAKPEALTPTPEATLPIFNSLPSFHAPARNAYTFMTSLCRLK